MKIIRFWLISDISDKTVNEYKIQTIGSILGKIWCALSVINI